MIYDEINRDDEPRETDRRAEEADRELELLDEARSVAGYESIGPTSAKVAFERGRRADRLLDAAADDLDPAIVDELERKREKYRELLAHVPRRDRA